MRAELIARVESATHTPGPWVANNHSSVFPCWRVETDHFANDGHHVASELEGPDAEANARLIAAAPDMLAVLWAMFCEGDVHVALAGNPIAIERLEAQARAAIARALPEPQDPSQ